MACHDPIGDMLTKIRNAIIGQQEKVDISSSKIKLEIIKILKNEGYIKNFKKIVEENHVYFRIFLKYQDKGKSVLLGLKRVSKPGRRIYMGYEDMPRLNNGMGTLIVSTSSGITTGKKAKEKKIGGEVLCAVW